MIAQAADRVARTVISCRIEPADRGFFVQARKALRCAAIRLRQRNGYSGESGLR
jgi:hypothetical protein